MAGKGIRIAGIVAIVIAALAAVFTLLNFVTRHPQRAIGAFVGCKRPDTRWGQRPHHPPLPCNEAMRPRETDLRMALQFP